MLSKLCFLCSVFVAAVTYWPIVDGKKLVSKGVEIDLLTSWNGTSYLHEIAAFLGDESPGLFWSFAKAWNSWSLLESSKNSNADAKSCWRTMSRLAHEHLSDDMRSVLSISLASRLYSPRLEAFNGLGSLGYSGKSCCWASINGHKIVDQANNIPLVLNEEAKLTSKDGRMDTSVYDFDIIHPAGTKGGNTTVVLYSSLDSDCSKEMHENIVKTLEELKGLYSITYAWRPINKAGCGSTCTNLGLQSSGGGAMRIPGYGVELAIKNMEYNARDDSSTSDNSTEDGFLKQNDLPDDISGFNIPLLIQRYPDHKEDLESFGSHLVKSSSSKKLDLKVWELADLGLQAAGKIIAAKDSLQMLRDVSQNFPNLVEMLSRYEASKELEDESTKLSNIIHSDAEYVMLNGIMLSVDDFNWHNLVQIIRSEVKFMQGLVEAGLPASSIPNITMLKNSGASNTGQNSFRLSLEHEGRVIWFNDIEKDSKYKVLPAGLKHLLQPAFFGQLPAVRRNLFNNINIVDVGTRGGISCIQTVAAVLEQGLPVRVGVLPVMGTSSTDAAKDITMLFSAIAASFGGQTAMEVFAMAADLVRPADWEEEAKFATAMVKAVKSSLTSTWNFLPQGTEKLKAAAFIKNALSHKSDIGNRAASFVENSTTAAQEMGIETMSDVGGVLLMNGNLQSVESTSMWQPILINSWQNEIRYIQESIYQGKLLDSSKNLLSDILQLSGALPRYNARIIKKESPIGRDPSEMKTNYNINLGVQRDFADKLYGLGLHYISSQSLEDNGKVSDAVAITHWVVVDVSDPSGIALASDALSMRSEISRTALILNAGRVNCERDISPIESLIVALSSGKIKQVSKADIIDIAAALKSFDPSKTTMEDIWKHMPESLFRDFGEMQSLLSDLSISEAGMFSRHCDFARQVLSLNPGTSGVFTNGMMLVNRFKNDIVASDFPLLDYVAKTKLYSYDILKILQSSGVSNAILSDLTAITSSLVASYQSSNARSDSIVKLMGDMTNSPLMIRIPSSNSVSKVPPLAVKAILNPLSKATQKVSPVLHFIKSHLHADIDILLVPKTGYSELPLKTFYRYVLPEFDESLKEESQGALLLPLEPRAEFRSLPLQETLTVGMDVPEMWLVNAEEAKYDLDNIKLSDLPASEAMVRASFGLESILVTGMCVDWTALENGQEDQVHPRGVQLRLGSKKDGHIVDTLVMSNLGYFQLKANPGIWQLQLADGRSQEVYSIDSATGRSEFSSLKSLASRDSNGVRIPVASFSGENLLLLLRPNKGQIGKDVLDVATKSWTKQKDDRIHVFTVASGHMYERLQKIMILSAIKRSSMRIKFWFIKNYMSPQMKQFVPVMARQYGFDYEFVTYKWPSWLHKQTEKQRIIWAYKILFLDVLFPLGLEKVIFCDSDQVIRADLKELWTYDLKGAPYGYTPFCDNNKDMDGFRFWNQGFWRNHLNGKPYHISALYVVDLNRFRQMAAGDRLRVLYDGLSKDPNSLANLDQDLPNYAQSSVPIKSLPQEWLWCETWCGNATRTRAKTIDLCNNPLTKEPKLQSARRIIAEWPDLNREAEEFTTRVEAILAGAMTEDELATDESRFRVELKPMVEGAVAYQGGQADSNQKTPGQIQTDHSEL